MHMCIKATTNVTFVHAYFKVLSANPFSKFHEISFTTY